MRLKQQRSHPYGWKNKQSSLNGYDAVAAFNDLNKLSEDPPSKPVIPGAYLSGYSGKLVWAYFFDFFDVFPLLSRKSDLVQSRK